jgi:hypothetical protein
MPSELQRVAQQLLATLDEIPRVVAFLHDRASKYRESAGWIGGMSNNPSARIAAMQLDEAARRCEEAAHHLSLALPKARSWVEQMVAGSRTTDPIAKRTSASPGISGGSARLPRMRTTDDIRRIFERLPVRKAGDKTRGIWIDDNGNDHDLLSGEHDSDYHAAQRFAERLGLVREPHKLSTAADVELKFAMRMRREGIRHAEIVLNNRPCEGRLGCNRLLKVFLPDGASLTVHGPDGFKKTYTTQEKE